MALYKNYNMFAVPISNALSVGDTYFCKDIREWRDLHRFHGLTVVSIDYWIHKRIWFDYSEWHDNNPECPFFDPPVELDQKGRGFFF